MTPRTRLQRWLTDPLEAALLWLGLAVFGAMRPETASNVGGWLGRTIGPLLPWSERARRNLRYVMPELSEAEIAAIVRGTWENHGRVFGEMAHMERMVETGRAFALPEDVAVLAEAKGDGRPLICVGGHLSNFELVSAVAAHCGFPVTAVYRAPNNPIVDRMWRRLRLTTEMLPKGPVGARGALQALNAGGNLALLVDQKFNEGIAVPFFGKPAMTTPAPAFFAARYKAPVVFGWVERLGPAHYRVRAEMIEPTEPAANSGAARKAAVADTTAKINARLEHHIRQNLADWFWLHRRWGKF